MENVSNRNKIKIARKYLGISAWDFDVKLEVINDESENHGRVLDRNFNDIIDIRDIATEGYEEVNLTIGYGENERDCTYWANIIN